MHKTKQSITFTAFLLVLCLPVIGESTNRGTWFWGESGKEYGAIAIVGNTARENEAIALFKEFGISNVYGSYQNRPVSDATVIAAWNTKLANNGIESFILFSEETWIRPINRTNMKDKIRDRFLNFNAGRDNADEHFKGIHFDLEPHRLPEWGTGIDKSLLFDLRTTFQDVRQFLIDNNALNIPIFADFPVWFDTSANIAWNDDTERNQWFDDLLGTSGILNGITLMAFERSLSGIESGIAWEISRYPAKARVALEADIGLNISTWPDIKTMLQNADQLESNHGDKIGIDIQSFVQFVDSFTLSFRDNFSGNSLSCADWSVDSNTLGRTQLGKRPLIGNGKATFEFHTYNPKNAGNVFSGTQVHTDKKFSRANLYEFEIVLDVDDPMANGLVAAIFPFVTNDDLTSDKINFELLSNWINDDNNNEKVQLVSWNDFDKSVGETAATKAENFPSISGFNAFNSNKFLIKWYEDRIEWYINDGLIYTENSVIPSDPMHLYLNIWAPLASFSAAYSADLQPQTSENDNTTYSFQIDHAIVRFIDDDNDHLADFWEITNFGNLNSGTYDDNNNNGISNIKEFINRTDSHIFRFKKILHRGWNFISFNVFHTDQSVANMFSSLMTQDALKRVIGDDTSFDPSIPSAMSTLTSLENGRGYWVEVSKNSILLLDNVSPIDSTSTLSLKSGWNNVGYIRQQGSSIRTALKDLINENDLASSNLQFVYGENKSFVPNSDDSINTLLCLKPGNGYWIKVATNQNFTYRN